MRIIKTLTLSILVVFAASCTKDPIADFNTDKEVYIAGETISCTNISLEGYHYTWRYSVDSGVTWMEETSSTGDLLNLTIDIDEYFGNGSVEIELMAESKNEKKSSTTSKSVTVDAATGDVMAYTNFSFYVNELSFHIGETSGTFTQDFSTEPACGATGTVNFNGLEVGTYGYKIYDSADVLFESGTVNVSKDNCTKVLVKP